MAAAFLTWSGAAWATAVQVVRPGLMCRSARALAILSFQNGASRIGTVHQRPDDLRLKASGGCIDLVPGMTLGLVRRVANTVIVTYDAGHGVQAWFVPGIDVAVRQAAMVSPNVGENFALFSATLARDCPGAGWDRAENAAYRAPIAGVAKTLSTPAAGAMNQTVGRLCAGAVGAACANEVSISFLVHLGRLPDLEHAFCGSPPGP